MNYLSLDFVGFVAVDSIQLFQGAFTADNLPTVIN